MLGERTVIASHPVLQVRDPDQYIRNPCYPRSRSLFG